MSKPNLNRLAGHIASTTHEPFGLGDLFALAAGLEVPRGFPAGTVAPDGIPDSEARQENRKRLAADFADWDHETLARAAAHLLEGSFLWRGVFAHYAKDREIELRRMKADHMEALIDTHTEFLEVINDPGTRAYLNAQARHATDPKASAKAEALKLWQDRRAGKYPKLRTNEQFAMECMRRWPVLTSAKVICGWCTEWNKAAKKSQPAS